MALRPTTIPSVQDVWNSIPAWGFPYIVSEVAPTPAAGTALATTKWAGQVGGVGGYVWINDSIYAEFTAYGALPPRLLTDLNGGAVGVDRFANAAPYWRVAYQKTWDKNSLMFGTFGMYTDTQPSSGTSSCAVSTRCDRSDARCWRRLAISMDRRRAYFLGACKLHLGE